MSKKNQARKWILFIVIAAALLATVAGILAERHFRRSDVVQLWFFDVGQGDSELIRAADGRTMLIDGGPDDSVLAGLSSALPWWQKKIDVVVLTHPHADHYVGLLGVFKKYRVGAFWYTGVVPPSATGRKFLQAVDDEKIPTRLVKAGDRFDFGGVRSFEVDYPFDSEAGRIVVETGISKSGGMNDTSIVGHFTCGAERAFYAGDAGFPTETRLIAHGTTLAAALLKIGHHGSAYSSSEAFLDAVHPADAVISDGLGNRYGHPAPRVIAALLQRGIRIHRTDRDGDVLFECAGGHLRQASAAKWWKL